MIRELMCKLGLHGPNFYGVEYGRTGVGFQRRCPHCCELWYGTEVEVGYGTERMRTVGDFQTEKQLRQKGLWK